MTYTSKYIIYFVRSSACTLMRGVPHFGFICTYSSTLAISWIIFCLWNAAKFIICCIFLNIVNFLHLKIHLFSCFLSQHIHPSLPFLCTTSRMSEVELQQREQELEVQSKRLKIIKEKLLKEAQGQKNKK